MADVIYESYNNLISLEKVDVCNQTSYNEGLPKCPKTTPTKSNPKTAPTIDANAYKELKERKRTDKRVFLNARPLVSKPELFADRVMYVLGKDKKKVAGATVYGYLHSCLSGTAGLVFPYTPRIQFNHSVNYERTDIIHSNIAVSHYKNTPPPSISIDAVFTADTKDMAKHMLSAIWYLRAVTKCDFGEQANNNENNGTAGVPPPILYLNGWNNMIDNVPVIVKSFSYTLPEDKDYVGLSLNLDSSTQEYINNTYSDSNTGTYFSKITNNAYESLKNITQTGLSILNGQPILSSSVQSTNALNSINTGSNSKNKFFLQEWLPTELNIHIELEIQYNLLKYKKVFNLNDYKMGILYLDNQKAGNSVYTINTNGDCVRLFEVEYEKIPVEKTITETIKDWVIGEKDGKAYGKQIDRTIEKVVSVMEQAGIKSKKEVTEANGYYFDVKDYKFDNSGWTW